VGAALGEVLARLAVAVLQWFMARKDLTDKVRLEVANGVLELAVRANEWKAVAAGRPDGGATLRVRDGAGTLILPSDDPGPGNQPPHS
jgi:hypothetical protein